MQRDIDLVRLILLDLEARGSYADWLDIDIEAYSPEQMDYHLELLVEAGFLRVSSTGRELARGHPVRLTWEGHEFLDAVRSDSRWRAVKALSEQVGGLPVATLRAALLEMARQEAGRDLPAP
jgi:hypothetical protein